MLHESNLHSFVVIVFWVYVMAVFCTNIFNTDLCTDETRIFQKYHEKICQAVTDINDLLKYFVQERIITIDEDENIRDITAKAEKVKQLLLHISGPLITGDNYGFYTMLSIFKNYGVKASQNLAKRIELELKSTVTTDLHSREQLKGW